MRLICALVLLIAVLMTGCSNGNQKAAELLDTAVFEEKQHNFEHATKLYDDILKNFPTSPAAKEASSRLAAIKQNKL